MIAIFLQILLLLLGACMFKVNRLSKYKIFIFSSICLTCVTITYIPFGNTLYFLSICFLLSELPYLWSHLRVIKLWPIYSWLTMMIVATIILAIMSPHYQTPLQWIRLLILELIGKYFILFYAFLCIKKECMLSRTFNTIYFSTLILTFFAIINLLLGYSPFISAASSMALSHDAISVAEAGSTLHLERFRVNSMFFSPFDYGYTCIMILLLSMWGYFKRYLKKTRFVIIVLCCLFGVLFCECRTNYLACVFSVLVFLYYSCDRNVLFKYLAFLLVIGVGAFITIPIFQEKVNDMLTMFDTNSEFKGSSIEMRLLQYSAAIYYMLDNPLFGRGKDFFLIDMGWGDGGRSTLVDSDLWGAEGVLMMHLLERGIIGTLFYVLFYSFLFRFIYKYRNVDKQTTGACLSILTAYMCMANISGELGSIMPTFLLVGAFLSILHNKTHHEIQYNHSRL